jgi:hypothetical protein
MLRMEKTCKIYDIVTAVSVSPEPFLLLLLLRRCALGAKSVPHAALRHAHHTPSALPCLARFCTGVVGGAVQPR